MYAAIISRALHHFEYTADTRGFASCVKLQETIKMFSLSAVKDP